VKRVLVTGASGFIGRHTLAAFLERDFEVHAASRSRPSGSTVANVTWHQVDLLDERRVPDLVESVQPTHLLHLAWCTEHGKYWSDPANLEWVASSLQLLRAFHELGGERAVVAGTCAEYDWSGGCCTPATPLRPATLYGASKHALHQVFDAYARSASMSAAWGRVFFAYGPGEQPSRVVATVARGLVRGQPVACSRGVQLRDFLYVEDVADAFVALVDSDAGGAFDIGSGEAIPLGKIVLRLGELAGKPEHVRLGEAPDRDEPYRIVADSPRLREELGWRPTRSLDEGLSRTLDWWREEHDAAASVRRGR